MSRLVDHEALLLDLRGRLRERASWGRGQVLELIDELEQQHRIDESVDGAFLRRFGDALHDQFLGLVPRSATTDPLGAADRFPLEPGGNSTVSAMDDGAASDHPDHGGDACQTTAPRRSSGPRAVRPLVTAGSLVLTGDPATT